MGYYLEKNVLINLQDTIILNRIFLNAKRISKTVNETLSNFKINIKVYLSSGNPSKNFLSNYKKFLFRIKNIDK